jgi:hypothetical protein
MLPVSDAPAPDIAESVRVTAQALGLVLTAEQRVRVALVFARNAELAARVMAFDLSEDAPPAPIFRP